MLSAEQLILKIVQLQKFSSEQVCDSPSGVHLYISAERQTNPKSNSVLNILGPILGILASHEPKLMVKRTLGRRLLKLVLVDP